MAVVDPILLLIGRRILSSESLASGRASYLEISDVWPELSLGDGGRIYVHASIESVRIHHDCIVNVTLVRTLLLNCLFITIIILEWF